MAKYEKLPKTLKVHPARHRRLYWDKDIYKEWYEFAKLAKTLPKDLADTSSFKTWFNLDLFAEPEYLESIQILEKKDTVITIKLDIATPFRTLMFNVLKLVTNYRDQLKFETMSRARYHPSQYEKKQIKLTTIQQQRQVYELHQSGISWLDIAIEMKYFSKKNISEIEIIKYREALDKYTQKEADAKFPEKASLYRSALDAAQKWVSDNIKKAEQIIANVEKGTFP